MVFRGKPSGACSPCRQRRIKCDKNVSGCNSCKRSGLRCHGYREVPQTIFYHETNEVIRKNRSTESRRSYPSPPDSISPNALTPSPEPPLVYFPLDRRKFHPDIDDLGICYFRADHFLRTVDPSLPDPVPGRHYDVLVACMKAHGLATCAVTESCSYTKTEARRYYLKALSKLNNVLVTADFLTDDDILLAVMILATIESIINSEQKSLEGWASHVQGCSAILSKRGVRQVRTPEGRLLFMQGTASLVSQCLLTSTRLPVIVETLTEEAAKYMFNEDSWTSTSVEKQNHAANRWFEYVIPDNATWAMHRALMTLTNINSDIKQGRITDAEEVTSQLRDQDERLVAAVCRVQAMTMTELKACADPPTPLTYEEAFDRYLKIQSIISMSSCRLLLHTMITDLLATQDETPTNRRRIETSTTAIQTMKSKILTIIPYQINLVQRSLAKMTPPHGFPNFRQLLSPPAGVSNAVFVAGEQMLMGSAKSGPAIFSENDPPILRVSHGYNFISALLLVGRVSIPGSEDLKTTCKLLRRVGEAFGVRQAEVFVERLEVRR